MTKQKIQTGIFILFLISFGMTGYGQGIGIGTTNPHASALLDLSSTTQGLLIPRMTSTQRTNIVSPATGLMVHDLTFDRTYVFDGTEWKTMGPWKVFGSQGIYYDQGGNIGFGQTPQGYIDFNIMGDDQITLQAWNDYNNATNVAKYGLYTVVTNNGEGDRYGLYSYTASPAGTDSDAYGVLGEAYQNNAGSNVYGIYGTVSGSGSGEFWAGYFDGDVRTSDQMVIGNLSPGQPDPSAILELQSTDKGLLLPRMTSSQRTSIPSPAEGLIVYDNSLNKPYINNGGAWQALEGGGSGGLWTEDTSPVGVFYEGGNVGIGTEAFLFSRLRVESGQSTNNFYAGYFQNEYTGTSTAQTFGLYAENGSDNTGEKFGVYGKAFTPGSGSSPTYGVYGIATATTGSTSPVYGVYGIVNGSGSGSKWAGYFQGRARVNGDLNVGNNEKVRIQPLGYQGGGEIEMYDDDGTKTIAIRANQFTSQGSQIVMTRETGSTTFVIDAEDGAGRGSKIDMLNSAGINTIRIKAEEGSLRGSNIDMFNNVGTKTIEIDSDYGNSGDGRVITDELEIKGGSDLAEYFTSSDTYNDLQPGQVVVIDPENQGHVKLSTHAYDKKVVGIVSGANGIKPGMLMGQRESIAFGDTPVAIAGRVYVQVDMSKRPIEPGDFLTTSDKPGKAMRVKKWGKSRGSIIGKALTYPDENGYVLVLVHLQ